MPIILNSLLFGGNDNVDGSFSTPPQGLLVESASPVDTGDGNDSLRGKADDSSVSLFEEDRFGVYLRNNLSLGTGNDSLTGEASSTTGASWVYGITLGFNEYFNASLNTGSGNDLVRGMAFSEAASFFVMGINQFFGNDIDTGIGGPGAGNRGNDTVIGEASGAASFTMAGLLLEDDSRITTNEGNDSVKGTAKATNMPGTAAGIVLNGGDNPDSGIYTGSGNDNVTAYATANNGERINGFAGGGVVDLGADNDTLEGFGDLIAHGGSGRDKWILSTYNSTDFTIIKGNTSQLQATFSGFGATAMIDGIEEFVFANGSFSYANLA